MFAFGSFELDTDRRQLSRDGAPVALSSRAFDILVMLVECRDRVVTKDEIMARVWRGMVVEENNLAVQISALRRALADGAESRSLIMTVPGQGYRFVGRLGACEPEMPAATAEPIAAPVSFAPEPAVRAAPPARARRWPVLIAALGLAGLGVAGLLALRPGRAPAPAGEATAPPRLSIAVLPFRDLSDDRCCDYLADAISDDLTTDLSLIPGSVVIARESSDVYRGHPAPAGEIGRALGVRYLLEGSLRAVDGAFSINAQLIETAGGTHLWAERFTVPRAHLADAQNAIVQRLSSALGVKLVDIEGARSVREHPDDPDSLDLFLRARSILDRADTLAAMNQAQALLEQAIAKQPDNVAALSELGWLLPRKANNYVTPHRKDEVKEAHNLVARALTISPRDPAVLVAQAALQMFEDDCGPALQTFQLALDGNPLSVRALTGRSVCEFQMGQFADARSDLQALLRIDPEGPHAKTRLYKIGFAELMLDHPQEAVKWLRRALADEPDPATGAQPLGVAEWAHAALVAALQLSGSTREAAALFLEYKKTWPNRSTWTLAANSVHFDRLPAFRHFLLALQAAGMPGYVDQAVGSATGSCANDDMAPTPRAVPGLRTIDTATVADLISHDKAQIIDFGIGAAVPFHAHRSRLDPSSATDMSLLAKEIVLDSSKTLVVMGNGVLDSKPCKAALILAGDGLPAVWYRGGEEAWSEARLESIDDR